MDRLDALVHDVVGKRKGWDRPIQWRSRFA
jgi:hypothetical protein